MRKLCTFFLMLLLGLGGSLLAQSPRQAVPGPVLQATGGPVLRTNGVQDTLDMYATRGTGYTIFGATEGYVFGTSSDGNGARFTEATGVYFDSVGDVNVLGVYGWFARKKVVGAAGNLKVELYTAAPDSMPNQLLGFGLVNMAFLDTNVSVNFNTLLGLQVMTISQGTSQVNEDFFIAINYEGLDDTLGMVSNLEGDGLGEKRCRQLIGQDFGGPAWARLSDFWSSTLDVDPVLYPIVEHVQTVKVEDQVFQAKGMQVQAAYPNPAMTESRLRFTLDEPAPMHIFVFNPMGQLVWEQPDSEYPAGQHEITLNLSDWPAGTYYYSISNGKGNITSVLRVVK